MAMTMSGEYLLAAPREEVWKKLNDPAVLKACIPGCESLEKTSDTSFVAVAKNKIGPVSARFKGRVTLSDLDPPNGYRARHVLQLQIRPCDKLADARQRRYAVPAPT